MTKTRLASSACQILALILSTILLAARVSAAPAGFFTVLGEPGRELGDDVVQLADGSYVLVGSTRSFAVGNSDVWVVRLDESGLPLWQRTYGGFDNEFALSVVASGDGGVVFTAFIGAGSFGGSAQDAWVVRLDAAGNVVWQKVFTGPGFDQIRAVKRMPDGGFALTGFVSPAFSPLDLWAARLDAAGNTLWEMIYPAAASGMGLYATSDGNLAIVGLTDDSPPDLFLARLNSVDGTVMWASRYGGVGADRANDLVELPDGSFVISGSTESFGLADRDAWVMRTDALGNVQWQFALGGAGSDSASGIDYVDGQLVIAGADDFLSASGSNFAWMARLDAATGSVLWRRSIGGFDSRNTGLGLDITADGGAVSAGTVGTGPSGSTQGDMYIAKVDSIGTVLSCPELEDAPVATFATGAVAIPLPLVGFNVALGEISSTAVGLNAPISNALICLADPVLFLDDLEDTVDSLGLPGGEATSLNAKIQQASDMLGDSNPTNDQAAITLLEAFIAQVEALRGKKLTGAEADELIDIANQIIDFLLAP